MPQRTQPPFRADHVGSLIRPDALIAAREAADKGALAAAELTRIQQAAIRDVVRLQQEAGLKVATDGEYNRHSWQRDFLLKIGNVKPMASRLTVRFHSAAGTRDHSPPSLQVVGPLSLPDGGIFLDDFKFLKSVAPAGVTPKLTIPSPTIVHFRGGREAIDARAYPQMEAFYDDLAAIYRAEIRALADAGCRYLQIDEVNLAYLCDPELRRQVANIGEDPDTLPKTYAKLLNAAIAGRPADMTICMHLCRGNFAGAWIAEGGYEPVAELLFNEIGVDGYFLEYDSPRAGGFAPLRFLPKGKSAVLGLVTTKSPKMESKDELKRRIEEASRHAPLDQLALSPQCGFSSGIGGNAMTVGDEVAKLKLVVETAREVWGEA
jgi:5-methyltetrahydropteroyltriglutamate--homocysteine methyltransferase